MQGFWNLVLGKDFNIDSLIVESFSSNKVKLRVD